jgi:hypothetical protein
MAIEMTAPRSRRALLTAAAGAAAATVVSAIDRPALVHAGTDGDVVLGAKNTTTTTTEIENGTDIVDVFVARSTAGGSAVVGDSELGTGVLGTGVHGVEGSSQEGMGVLGVSATGTGVLGHITLSGSGVRGHSFSAGGVGVLASAEAGTALQVAGRARFSRSGRATVAAGRSSVDVDLRTNGGLAGTPLCFANLTSYRIGTYVIAARPNYPSTGKLRIYLNKAATSSAYVAWLVLG